ncbi:hypothetical protein [Klebsiella pneumoniae]|uniref:hypothetical protein n=1 Tax=Klebsiella pneumoniae TaxID=573 RepID=UPI0010D30981|nr:hypothetical protein [Klebsiella pneumoniae]VGH79831.1 Uncharacterised protein [Klebsiella pneumoniae]
MSFFLKSLAAGVFTIASFSVGATTAPVLDTTPQMAYEDISRSLTELQPITFQSGVEKYKSKRRLSTVWQILIFLRG